MKISHQLFFLLLFGFSGTVFAQLRIEDVKVDSSISGFHLTANYDGALIYTPNGYADIGVVKNPSAFSITLLPDVNYESARDEIEQMMEISSVQDGNTQDQIVRKDTVSNGQKMYTVSLRETKKGTLYHNLIFYGFFLKGDTAVLFIAGDLDKGKYIDKFRRTFYALKLK